MRQQTNQKSSAISPITLIILGIALIAVVVLLWPQSGKDTIVNKPSTNDIPNNNTVTNVVTNTEVNSDNVQNNITNLTSNSFDSEKEVVNVHKNPFKTPSIIVSMLAKRNSSGMGQVPSPAIPVTPPEEQNIFKDKEDSKTDYALSWRGIIGTKNDQVAIIRNKGKTHFLRLGDRLAETSYTLSRIEKQYIILQSPTEQIILEKSKEAKLR
ncbi:MAG TPA: hypothetical protein PLZ08_03235 [Bacillota bacterium]|nr:hypothetical protein [Bacillota bacterium]HOL09291.1 hypothetical protein [Bacillota bacterium]HPO96954.1 hypothetical protein [Bacillota bacterium]